MKARLKWSRHCQRWYLVIKDQYGRWDYHTARRWIPDVAQFNRINGKQP